MESVVITSGSWFASRWKPVWRLVPSDTETVGVAQAAICGHWCDHL